MTPARLSPSALGRYRVCPKQFRLVDLERAPRAHERSPILTQGNAVHEALDKFFGLPQEERRAENLERALRAVWPKHREAETFNGVEEERTFGQQSIAMLQRFAEAHDLDASPLAREQWVSVRIDGVQLFGKLDRVDRSPSGGLVLTDYKTGRRMLDETELRHEPAVQVYICGAEHEWRLPVERIQFVYLATGTTVDWSPEREDVVELREQLGQTLADIRADESWEARPGDWCRFCSARLHCPDRQRVDLDELQPVENLPF